MASVRNDRSEKRFLMRVLPRRVVHVTGPCKIIFGCAGDVMVVETKGQACYGLESCSEAGRMFRGDDGRKLA